MTINEFCEKYNVDRNTVYNSTYLIPHPTPCHTKNMQFDEQELLVAVRQLVTRRVNNYKGKLDEAVRVLGNLS